MSTQGTGGAQTTTGAATAEDTEHTPDGQGTVTRNQSLALFASSIMTAIAALGVTVIAKHFLEGTHVTEFLLFWSVLYSIIGVISGIQPEVTRAVGAARRDGVHRVRVDASPCPEASGLRRASPVDEAPLLPGAACRRPDAGCALLQLSVTSPQARGRSRTQTRTPGLTDAPKPRPAPSRAPDGALAADVTALERHQERGPWRDPLSRGGGGGAHRPCVVSGFRFISS